jgi:hypothetical protein
MNCVQCSVRPEGRGGWIAELEDRATGPYLSQDIAPHLIAGCAGSAIQDEKIRYLNKPKAADHFSHDLQLTE